MGRVTLTPSLGNDRSTACGSGTMAMARDNGLERAEQIGWAILERNGESAILPDENKT